MPPRFAHGFRKVGHLESVVQKKRKVARFCSTCPRWIAKKSAGMSNVFFSTLGFQFCFGLKAQKANKWKSSTYFSPSRRRFLRQYIHRPTNKVASFGDFTFGKMAWNSLLANRCSNLRFRALLPPINSVAFNRPGKAAGSIYTSPGKSWKEERKPIFDNHQPFEF